MITLLSNSPLGVCEWSVSEEVEIEKIDKRGQAPNSTITFIDGENLRVFILMVIRPNGLNYRRWKGNEFSYGYCIN